MEDRGRRGSVAQDTEGAAMILTLIFLLGTDGCGLLPLKPLPPIGCKDMTAVCVCDRNGTDCHWEWICVPSS